MVALQTDQLEKIVKMILKETDLPKRRMIYFQLCQNLTSAVGEDFRPLLPLLTDWDFEIRRETAYWLDACALPLNKKEQRKLQFAAMQFELLKYGHDAGPKTHAYLVRALLDRSQRVREKALRVFHLSDCQTDEETLIYWYSRGDYLQLLKFAREHGLEKKVKTLLKSGLAPGKNIPFHQRQCAYALKQLDVEIDIPSVQKPKVTEETFGDHELVEKEKKSPLKLFLEKLNKNGLLTISGKIYPTIHIVSKTGRITYKNPGIQNWPDEKKEKEIIPYSGQTLWRFDYKQIEPRILLHFLIQNFWISLTDIPEDDIYKLTGIPDRNQAKQWFNKMINGGRVPFSSHTSRKMTLLKEALDNYRLEMTEYCRLENGIETIGKRKINIDAHEKNYGGLVINRIVQGSAADFFNEAMIALDAYIIMENLPAQIVLLLFDEVWLSIDIKKQNETAEKVADFLNCIWKNFNLFLPIHVRYFPVDEKSIKKI